MAVNKSQGNQFFNKLKKFFSSSIVLKYEEGDKIKVFDVDNLQVVKNVETNRLIDQQGSVYQHFYEVGGNISGMGFNTMRADLYRNFELMDQDPLVSSVLDIYSEETCLRNEYGELLTINSTKDSIKSSLENLFYDVLNIEFNLSWWVRNLVKYGDFFLKLDIVETVGVTNVIPLSSYGMERYEDPANPDLVKFKYDESLGTSLISYTKRTVTQTELENYEVAHFRLLSDSNYLPYGRSILENARKIWNQLTLMIDAMLIHRITRAPDKRLFYVDVGTIAPDQVEAHMQNIINKMKKIPIINETTGEFNLRYNLQNQQEDFYLPVRGDKSGTRIETLPGMQWTGIEDLDFLQQRMFAALKVPMAFLNDTEGLGNKCLGPNTIIPLLDGRKLTIKELSDIFSLNVDPNLWVYSFDFKTNSAIPSKIKLAEKTRLDTQVIKVYLDNGTDFICTPDHHLLLKDGTEIEAQNSLNESLQTTLEIQQKSIKIEWLNETIDTYNLEVENENHNYLIENGIVIKNSTLAAQDLRFARSIDKVQKILISELTKIAVIHLYAQGYSVEDIIDFEIEMSSPSTVFENEKVELLSNKTDLAGRIKELKLHSDKWIYNNIFDMSDEEAEDEEENIIYDLKKSFRHGKIEEEGEDPAADFGLDAEDDTMPGDEGDEEFDSSIDKSQTEREEEGEDLNATGQEAEETAEKAPPPAPKTPEAGRHPKIGDSDKKEAERATKKKVVKVKPTVKKKPEVELYKRQGLKNPLLTTVDPQKDKRDRKPATNIKNQLKYRPHGGSPLARESTAQKDRNLLRESRDDDTFMDENVLL